LLFCKVLLRRSVRVVLGLCQELLPTDAPIPRFPRKVAGRPRIRRQRNRGTALGTNPGGPSVWNAKGDGTPPATLGGIEPRTQPRRSTRAAARCRSRELSPGPRSRHPHPGDSFSPASIRCRRARPIRWPTAFGPVKIPAPRPSAPF
jgi:hypothetical protein